MDGRRRIGNGDPDLALFGEKVTPESSRTGARVCNAGQPLRERRGERGRAPLEQCGVCAGLHAADVAVGVWRQGWDADSVRRFRRSAGGNAGQAASGICANAPAFRFGRTTITSISGAAMRGREARAHRGHGLCGGGHLSEGSERVGTGGRRWHAGLYGDGALGGSHDGDDTGDVHAERRRWPATISRSARSWRRAAIPASLERAWRSSLLRTMRRTGRTMLTRTERSRWWHRRIRGAHAVDSTFYSTCSLLRTMEIGARACRPMSQYDAGGNTANASFTSKADTKVPMSIRLGRSI